VPCSCDVDLVTVVKVNYFAHLRREEVGVFKDDRVIAVR
jgi:hypothetical protein